ncbi:SGNH/GDSL hydrolase family protein [Phenylobacterium sp.]|jgi:lysophospholipase L1-like esterase|uniref:SGNH/GDSL hydrolase family protein n=1 Tax=Phenylobacterium sp. TaxID=1871053 RepID=UPI0012124E84|nr:SGNH/GDSL hydrolase family protein [Phenylobacterium sp.]THD51324.1 MAG: SGNH/GDSL hydrolase family protein [Phenylobacterium sp.]
MRLAILACAFALAAPAVQAAPAHWIGSWGASPALPMAAPPNNPARGTPTFSNQTITQVVRLSAGGPKLRIRLSNEYGAKPLQIGAARVALVGADGAVVAGSERTVTFSGAAAALIPQGAPMLSDAVALPTKPLARLRVSLFLPADTNGCTCHMTGMDLISIAPGDATKAPPAPAKGAGDYRAFLTEVDVETAAPSGPVIATFGDSITDGYRSTDDTNHRWPDRLAERLAAGKQPFAVVNTAISGNRVLAEALPIFGQNALSRFDRDVLSAPGVTHVTVLEGVNDLGMTKPTPAAADIIAGYRQLIARAHEHGLKIIGGTILPYGGAAYFSAAGEAERQKINAWIRTGHEFDGVIDFDAAIRDPVKPERMRAELQSGDWLHPNDAGYRVMGDAVDLKLFR